MAFAGSHVHAWTACRKIIDFRTAMAALLFAVVVLSAFSILISQHSEAPPVPARTMYTSHAPIYINGNADFTAPNGVSGGAGTTSNPYIISGWDIDASGDNGIMIQGTTAYFIIRNCYIHDGGLNYEGIYLLTCTHGTVTGNTLTDNYDGVYLDLSDGNTISNNNCTSHDQADMYGMYIQNSDGNSIIGNNCSNNDDGIFRYIGFQYTKQQHMPVQQLGRH